MLRAGEEGRASPSPTAANFTVKHSLVAAFRGAEWHSSSFRSELGNDTAASLFQLLQESFPMTEHQQGKTFKEAVTAQINLPPRSGEMRRKHKHDFFLCFPKHKI